MMSSFPTTVKIPVSYIRAIQAAIRLGNKERPDTTVLDREIRGEALDPYELRQRLQLLII